VRPSAWSHVALLDSHHDISTFSTGLASVDQWFANNALPEQAAGRVRTHVCLSEANEIVAFFSLKHIIVTVEGASSILRQTAETAGATTGLLLAQMGVRTDLQGAGVGKQVIRQVMTVAANLHAQAPFRLLVVDAEHEGLVSYYRRLGFRRLTNDPRLVMKMSAVHKILQAGSPP
jgi:predicted N-acetyltransferase YhbS